MNVLHTQEVLTSAVHNILSSLHRVVQCKNNGKFDSSRHKKSSRKRRKSQSTCSLLEVFIQDIGIGKGSISEKCILDVCATCNSKTEPNSALYKEYTSNWVNLVQSKAVAMRLHALHTLRCTLVELRYFADAIQNWTPDQENPDPEGRQRAVVSCALIIVQQLAEVQNVDSIHKILLSIRNAKHSLLQVVKPRSEAQKRDPVFDGKSRKYRDIRKKWSVQMPFGFCTCRSLRMFDFISNEEGVGDFVMRNCSHCLRGKTTSLQQKLKKIPLIQSPSVDTKEVSKSWQEILGVLPGDLDESEQSAFLKCSKCETQDCSYRLVATRSGDEGMTAFCYCRVCKHSWKMRM